MNKGIIPGHPSYSILHHTLCDTCDKYPQLLNLSLEKAKPIHDMVFLEHFPALELDQLTKEDKRVMMVGEAPGRWEIFKLRPFIGRSGQLLRKTMSRLEYVNLSPPWIRVLFTNAVKCRCVGPPDIDTIRACKGALSKEADLFQPDMIIGLGKTAFHILTDLGFEYTLGDARTTTHYEFRGFPCRFTYHPAAALRHTSYRIPFNQDLRRFRRELDERSKIHINNAIRPIEEDG